MSPQQALLYAYGIFLMNGGTPDDFNKLNDFDVQVLLMAYTGSELHNRNKMLEGFGKLLESAFGRGE